MGSGGSRPPWPPGNSSRPPRGRGAALPQAGPGAAPRWDSARRPGFAGRGFSSSSSFGQARRDAAEGPARPPQAAWVLYGQASRAISIG